MFLGKVSGLVKGNVGPPLNVILCKLQVFTNWSQEMSLALLSLFLGHHHHMWGFAGI
jgi:hypothetical protein